MFLIAAVVLCSHQQAVAKNIASATTSCSDSDKGKLKKCMTQTVSIDKCCPLFKRTIGANCKCYNYAEDLDNQALITLQSYCDVNNPCKSVQKVVADGSRTDTVEAVATLYFMH
uniref:Cysteine-rich extensin-2 n=1 Tax=Solanum tuberosum TaxID=4113 RepID=M1D5Q0_SOLTU